MKLFSVLYSLVFALTVAALPQRVPVGHKFEIRDGSSSNTLSARQEFPSFTLAKRGNSSKTIDSIILAANRSGLVFTLLDAFAGHPDRIKNLANTTAGLIKGGSSLNISSSQVDKLLGSLNLTKLLAVVEDSGLLTSTLDGILLDEDYRPVIVKLAYRILSANKATLLYLIDTVFEPASLKKREEYTGSLLTFALNIVSGFLGSDMFYDIIAEGANSLNNTGVAVYTIKRVLANETYQNMTFEFASDLYATGALNFNLSSIDISGLVSSFLGDGSSITGILDTVLSGNITSSLSGAFAKYGPALSAIVTDLQSTGIFQELNDYIFPETTTTAASSTSTANKKEKETMSATATQSGKSTSSHNGASTSGGYAWALLASSIGLMMI